MDPFLTYFCNPYINAVYKWVLCILCYTKWTLMYYVHKHLPLPRCLITCHGWHFIIFKERFGSGSHNGMSSPLCIFIWADYYAGGPPSSLLCPFEYIDPAIHKGSTSVCDAAHTRLCAGSSQGDVRSGWGWVLFLTGLPLCRNGAFIRKDICIGNMFHLIKVAGRRHQAEFAG